MKSLFIRKNGEVRWGLITSLISVLFLVAGTLLGAGIQIGGFSTNKDLQAAKKEIIDDMNKKDTEVIQHVDKKDEECMQKIDKNKKEMDEKLERTVTNIYNILLDIRNGKSNPSPTHSQNKSESTPKQSGEMK